MNEYAKILKVAENEEGTYMTIVIPGVKMADKIELQKINDLELRMDDGRTISNEQRRKIFKTLDDMGKHFGVTKRYMQEQMKTIHIEKEGCEYFSLSNCTMTRARKFIDDILEFCLENGVVLSESALLRADNIERYLYNCIKHKICCIGGHPGEVHHVDTIGMGVDRTKHDDSNHEKICLERVYHDEAHRMGWESFSRKYKVFGVKYVGDE